MLRDSLVEMMRRYGLDVRTDWKESQRVLDEENGNVQLNKAQKRALETASVSEKSGTSTNSRFECRWCKDTK